MANIFQELPASRPSSNTFNLSFDHKTTTDMGRLTPVLLQECIPGDKWRLTSDVLVRLAPLLAPIMHRVDVSVHYFFVPNRILWNNWEAFITGGLDGTNNSAFPTMNDMTVTESSLGDYLGLPSATFNLFNGRPSAIPFAAYARIMYEYYRDENLGFIPASLVGYKDSLIDGVQSTTATSAMSIIRQRAWRKDYFTSALPFAQKGSAVLLPLSFNDVPVVYGTGATYVRQFNTLTNPANGTPNIVSAGNLMQDSAGNPLNFQTDAVADTSSLTGNTTINEFRRALRLQEWLEKNARGGSRYAESILSHFGVKSSDARLQRPEFLGGFREPVVISEVLQTSGTGVSTSTPLAQTAGHGITVGHGKNISYYCEEHGYIMGIMSILPQTAYQQGLPRHWSKFTRFDYFWPSFANLGEQEILNKELYYGSDGLNNNVFGYTPRYAEYKYNPSVVTGAFKTSLAYWHLGRIFSSRPVLNASFVQSDPSKRVFAVTSPGVDSFYCHLYHRIYASRKMPVFGVPTI